MDVTGAELITILLPDNIDQGVSKSLLLELETSTKETSRNWSQIQRISTLLTTFNSLIRLLRMSEKPFVTVCIFCNWLQIGFIKTFFTVAICMLFLYFKVVRTRNGLGSLGNDSSDDPGGNGEADEGILY